MLSRTLQGLLAISASIAILGCNKPKEDQTPTEQPTQPVEVRILAINDLHGNIEQPGSGLRVDGEKVPAGGLDVMATYINTLRQEEPNTAFVCAGDLIGASPLISALFHDEPTIEAMNKLQLDVLAVGNHEFDDGVEEITRLANGGCHKELGCQGKESFEGANFPFLAANVIVEESQTTLFPASLIKEYEGVKVGFIGLTLEGTDKAVSPEAIKGITFLDEAETINKEVKLLQQQGVETIIVVMHEGGWQGQRDDFNGCESLDGPIVEINKNVDPAVDVIITGHTHQYYNCLIDNRIVTSAKDYGRMITSIDLSIDPTTGDVVSKQATNIPILRKDMEINPEMASHLQTYRELVAPLASKNVGLIKADIARSMDEQGNSPVGQIVADAQWLATQSQEAGGAHFALMNPGGVRNDLVFAPTNTEPEGVLTYEELHSIQPFGNTLTVIALTGAQIEALLEEQWGKEGRLSILQPSKNFTYTWHDTEGDHVKLEEIILNGQPLVADQTYNVTVNSFLASGGDGFTTLTKGTIVAGGPVDLDVFVNYIEQNSPIQAPEKARIVKK